jgi:hypothetical protein
MPSKKRQHFVPRFLLRRFAATEGRWQGHVFRLPIPRGAARPAVPKTEAARNRYYDLPNEVVGEVQPELILEKIESGAAAAIALLENRQHLRAGDLVWLAYFAALQTNRTPADRAEARYLDEVMAAQMEELRFSAREQAVAFLRECDPSLTEDEAEAERERIIEDLNAGRIRLESNAEREVASMFLGLNEAVEQLLSACDFTLIELPRSPELVLPDTGYTRYDPNRHSRDGHSCRANAGARIDARCRSRRTSRKELRVRGRPEPTRLRAKSDLHLRPITRRRRPCATTRETTAE